MTANTGRTSGKWIKWQLEDSAGTLRDLPISSINGLGLNYPEVDVSAIQDAVKGFLTGQPDYSLEVGGPFDTAAAQAASGSGAVAALSGSHTVLYPLNGVLTPLGFAIYLGIRHAWETGEPVFGLASSAANGLIEVNYNPDFINGTYMATFRLYPGSAVPAWGTAAIS